MKSGKQQIEFIKGEQMKKFLKFIAESGALDQSNVVNVDFGKVYAQQDHFDAMKEKYGYKQIEIKSNIGFKEEIKLKDIESLLKSDFRGCILITKGN